ncbi:MAG TPA: DNA cytosine methyltransferase [Solirubrobacteraceae bacterium]
MNVGSCFSGVGILDYGLTLAGLKHAWFCEADEFRRSILAKRWPGKPIVSDIRGLGAATVQRVDVIAGGFPCKGASTAGKRNGFEHAETVLWREMARAIGELRPRYVLLENVANLLVLRPDGGEPGELWAEVLGTLAALGFDVEWDCLPAAAVGAPHLRDRVFAIATHADGEDARWHSDLLSIKGGRPDAGGDDQTAANSGQRRLSQQPQRDGAAARGSTRSSRHDAERRGVRVEWGDFEPAIGRWEQIHGLAPEPLVRRVDDRGAMRVERSRLSALGDGVQVQVGRLVGERLLKLERKRVKAEAQRRASVAAC